jgi:hypothetical protein
MYSDDTKVIMPYKYNTVHDFDRQNNVIIAETQNIISWFTDFYQLREINGTLYNEPFICSIQQSIYKAVPVSAIPKDWGKYTLLFPQVKKLFTVNGGGGPKLLIIQNIDGVKQYYTLTELMDYSIEKM